MKKNTQRNLVLIVHSV